jgi:hypothetical protein
MLTRTAPDPTTLEESITDSPVFHTPCGKDIALLTNSVPGTWALALAEQLRAAGSVVQFVQWEDTPEKDQCIVALVDLDGAFLYQTDESRYQTLQEFLVRVDEQRLFWIIRNTMLRKVGSEKYTPDPRYALIFGFLAALRMEMDSRLVSVQINEFNDAAVHALLQIVEKVLARPRAAGSEWGIRVCGRRGNGLHQSVSLGSEQDPVAA